MPDIQIPKLTVVNLDRPKKPKILLLSDDLQSPSGIGSMSREFVVNTAEYFDWVQIAAAVDHPAHGQILDLSPAFNDLTGLDHCSVKAYAHSGYGNPAVLRELVQLEKPDAILHFTDPRYWTWLYDMEHEIHNSFKIPLMYYNIWDCPPAPRWNEAFYRSCDLIMNITKQTQALVESVLKPEDQVDLDMGEDFKPGKTNLAYVTHGVPDDMFKPMQLEDEEYFAFVQDFKTKHNVNFIVFWNNRNAARKQPGNVLLAFKTFCDSLPTREANRCALLMHTDVQDPNGTDLLAVKANICPDYKVVFSTQRISVPQLNWMYNMADVTLNIATNEGFGLSNAESVMAGTCVVASVTGGLQDQMRFTDDDDNWLEFTGEFPSNHTGRYKNHGPWVYPVFPVARSLQGSLQTPYIFDDHVRFEDVAAAIKQAYDTPTEVRKDNALIGRKWMMSSEASMTAKHMGRKMRIAIQKCLNGWKPSSDLRLFKIAPEVANTNPIGITID